MRKSAITLIKKDFVSNASIVIARRRKPTVRANSSSHFCLHLISFALWSKKWNSSQKWGISTLAWQWKKKLATNRGRGNKGKPGFSSIPVAQELFFLLFSWHFWTITKKTVISTREKTENVQSPQHTPRLFPLHLLLEVFYKLNLPRFITYRCNFQLKFLDLLTKQLYLKPLNISLKSSLRPLPKLKSTDCSSHAEWFKQKPFH